jgi:hypothetical protein
MSFYSFAGSESGKNSPRPKVDNAQGKLRKKCSKIAARGYPINKISIFLKKLLTPLNSNEKVPFMKKEKSKEYE